MFRHLTDQERDAETDLHYFGARYYDPWIGKFMSQDPELIGPKAGITFNRIGEDAQNLNAYSYALNRPTIMVDRNGESAWRAAVGVGRVILSGGKVGLEVASIVDDVRTVSNPNASTGERVIAGISLASGIPGGWLKKIFKIADKAGDTRSAAKAATGTENAADATRTTTTVETVTETRKTPGKDGGISTITKEKVDGKTTSVQHTVTKDGEVVHQHQHHIGKEGSKREFSDELTGNRTIEDHLRTPVREDPVYPPKS